MLTHVLFLSKSKMEQVRAARDTVVISILDSTERPRPRLAGFGAVLCLDFEDNFEELHQLPAGAWPDEPSTHEHAQLALGAGERVPALSDARRIVQFLREHAYRPEALTLVVHCMGGVSRSAAVALFAADRYAGPLGDPGADTSRANPRLLRLLVKAHNES